MDDNIILDRLLSIKAQVTEQELRAGDAKRHCDMVESQWREINKLCNERGRRIVELESAMDKTSLQLVEATVKSDEHLKKSGELWLQVKKLQDEVLLLKESVQAYKAALQRMMYLPKGIQRQKFYKAFIGKGANANA
jgi:hypothetical protein